MSKDNSSDFQPGNFVTVSGCRNWKNKKFRGDIFQVVVVDPPFLVVDPQTGRASKRFSLDCTEYVVQPASDDYVKALLPAQTEDKSS